MENKAKKVADSYTEQVQIVTQSHINGYCRLFGGQLMEWIDIVAAVVARRHSEKNVTTLLVDTMRFKKPAYANDTLVLTAYLTYVGNTSMEVCVETFVENLHGERIAINKAYFVFVALDEDEKPTQVPRLMVETDIERERWQQAEVRREARKKIEIV